jgi:uncharacterized protein YbjT (DUF2867 family)
MTHPRTALLLGATGLVGRELLAQLLADDAFSRVRVIARRSTNVRHAKLDEQLFPLEAMPEHEPLFAVDHVFCALGTTIRTAGSEERFRHVDHDLPLLAARLGRANGAQHFLLVSSHGADPQSRVFYTRVKGEVERDLRAIGYPRVTIARPSFIKGVRAEFRPGELVTYLGFLMPASIKPVAAKDVARVLVEAARAERPGIHVIASRAMQPR